MLGQLRQASGGQGSWSVPTAGIRVVILSGWHGFGLLVIALPLLGCSEGLGCRHFQGLTQGLAFVRTLMGLQSVASGSGGLGECRVLRPAPHSWVQQEIFGLGLVGRTCDITSK